MRRFFVRLIAFFRRGRAEREMSREMAAHLALMEDDFQSRGMSAEEAHLAALRAYGGVEQAKEEHRDARSFVSLEQVFQDVRHAARGLWKNPALSAVTLASLAFGIGVNTAIFTLVNGILLRKLPVPEPERVVQVQARRKAFDSLEFSYSVYRELRRQKDIFAALIGFFETSRPVNFGDGVFQSQFGLVTGSYFAFFSARPPLGRMIDEDDDRLEGASPVCVISYDAWQTHFGGDPGVLNRTIYADGVPLRVIGVAPRDFVGADLQRRNKVWAPTALVLDLQSFPRDSQTANRGVWLRIMGRLNTGVSLAKARARLEAASPAIQAALPSLDANGDATYQVVDGSKGTDRWRSSLRDPLAILMGAVTLVLLVACANLANLLLARTTERRQEFAIKLALGISRARLLRQLLLETFAVALAGGALAWLVAIAVTHYLLYVFNTGSTYRQLHVSPDYSVLLYTFAVCLLTALLAGLYPAYHASRTDIARQLPRSLGRGLVRRGLIIVQVTLAVVLLFGASLFVHSLRKLKTVDLGYDVDRTASVRIEPTARHRHEKPRVPPPELAEVLVRVRHLPSVEAAAWSSGGMLSGMAYRFGFETQDRSGTARKMETSRMAVGAGFFSALRIPLLKGRDFGPGDRAGSSTAVIVNQRLAELAWPGEDPIGKRIPGGTKTELEVVGVVGNSNYLSLRETTRPILYTPFDQAPGFGGMLQIRCRSDLRGVERAVRQIVESTAPAYQVSNLSSLELLRDSVISQDRLLAFLSSLFAALGTALALAGIYGLISYSVTQRTREVGIRVSVGAQRGDVLRLFLRESALLVAAGMALGLPLALALARLISAMLYNVSTAEPVDIAITLACLAAGSMAAAYFPGRRATRIDPVTALRYD